MILFQLIPYNLAIIILTVGKINKYLGFPGRISQARRELS